MSENVANQKSHLISVTAASSANDESINIGSLVERNLFGDSDAPVVEAPVEVEVERETRLNLKLRGIYAANVKDHSNSIIEDGTGKQAVYFIDDKLTVSGAVYLRQVYPNKVILETNGVKEVLRLKDELPASMKSAGAKPTGPQKVGKARKNSKIDMRKNSEVSKSLNKYRDQLSKDPLSLVGLVNYQPKLVDGKMVGIQISPGKDKRLFTQLGLRRKDVITSINGVSLDDPQSAFQLLGDIQNMQELSVEIQRNDKTVSLLLNLSDPSGI